jgi:hypothetical protein
VSPVKYELDSYIPDDDILHSHCSDNFKCYLFFPFAVRDRESVVSWIRQIFFAVAQLHRSCSVFPCSRVARYTKPCAVPMHVIACGRKKARLYLHINATGPGTGYRRWEGREGANCQETKRVAHIAVSEGIRSAGYNGRIISSVSTRATKKTVSKEGRDRSLETELLDEPGHAPSVLSATAQLGSLPCRGHIGPTALKSSHITKSPLVSPGSLKIYWRCK